MKEKIKSKSEILKTIKELRLNNKIIACTSGSFDLLNAKHIEILGEFKKQADVLIIFLNSDKSVKLYKGPNRPIISESDRKLQLAAVQFVDYIVLFDDINPLKLIDAVKPDVYCNGADWGKDFFERKYVETYGGKIYISKLSKRESTSDIINRIQNLKYKKDVKALFLDRDSLVIVDVKFVKGILKLQKIFIKNNYKIIFMSKPYRKSLSDMIVQAAKKHKVAIARSIFIGYNNSDIETARSTNSKTILINQDRKNSKSDYSFDSIEHLLKNIKKIEI